LADGKPFGFPVPRGSD